MESIKAELAERLTFFRARNRLLEAQRLEQRTLFDLEMFGRSATATGSRTTRATSRAGRAGRRRRR
jgi:excinuclease ABC subunit B